MKGMGFASWTGLAVLLCLGCNRGGGAGGGGTAAQVGDGDLLAVEVGRLVDIYGRGGDGNLYMPDALRDRVIGTDVADGVLKVARVRSRSSGRTPSFEAPVHFAAPDPESGQEKLIIDLPLYADRSQTGGPPTHPEFLDTLDGLDDRLQPLGRNHYGQDILLKPFPVAPRNGAIRLTFSRPLGVPADHFRVRDGAGRITGMANTRAVQLLEILGDPTEHDPAGAFRAVPCRIAVRENVIVLDPVILGREGQSHGLPANAEGLPRSLASTGANMRIALPLAGPVRLFGLRETNPVLVGSDAHGQRAMIRDFRSGNAGDSGPTLTRGFLNDPIPPRLLGECLINLLEVHPDPLRPGTRYRRLKLHQGAMKHHEKYAPHRKGLFSPVEIDPFDIIRQNLQSGVAGGRPRTVRAEVVGDIRKVDLGRPDPDHPDQPLVHYWVRVRMESDQEFILDRDAGGAPLPTDVVQVTTYEATTTVETGTGSRVVMPRDDPRYFLSFSPAAPDPRFPTDNISPFASVLVRFTKPVDLSTVRPLDSLILSCQETGPGQEIQNTVLHPVAGTPGLVASRIHDLDGTQRTLRSQPPLGFYHDGKAGGVPKTAWDPAPYRALGVNPPATTDRFFLYLLTGKKGIRDLAGNPISLGPGTKEWIGVEFTIRADAPTNRVANLCRRFLAADEDPYNTLNNLMVQDWFGAVTLLPDGWVEGRPTTRESRWVDDLNQRPEPADPNAPDLRFCRFPTEIHYPTGGFKFGQGVQNPLNPLGCRQQSVWREIDLSLSRLDPYDYNLDVEQLWWCPFTEAYVAYDIFDRITLHLGHSEYRPSNCHNQAWALPQYPNSGLKQRFAGNYLDGAEAERYTAFEDVRMVVERANLVLEPQKKYGFLKFPVFRKPYFTWRDEREMRLGGGQTERVLSPWLGNYGGTATMPSFNGEPPNRLPSIALPLLADFLFHPDDPSQNGAANGFNGWQVSIGSQSSVRPNFRVYSAGGYSEPGALATPPGPKVIVDPATQTLAQGGFRTDNGQRTPWGDNTVYWIRADFLKRISVMTYGFVDLLAPNQSSDPGAGSLTDPRYGGFPAGARHRVSDLILDPPQDRQPRGARVTAWFRSAQTNQDPTGLLHPLAACESHVTTDRFRGLSAYVAGPGRLWDKEHHRAVGGAPLDPAAIRYVNWRLVFENNTEVSPPLAPRLDSFAWVYRLDR